MFGSSVLAACSPNQISLRGPWGQVKFNVEIADDNPSRALGLMNRPSMPQFSGMVFVYDAPQHARFWMKNTLIPLDMIFMDVTGTVTTIRKMAVPESLDIIDGGTGVLSVLEINGGLADTLGISVGSQAQHSSFGENAVWGCNQ
jgi:uncharacterized membrane protein (UPF0127 family)